MTSNVIVIVDKNAGTEREVDASEVPHLPKAKDGQRITRITKEILGNRRIISYFAENHLVRRDTAVAKKPSA